MWEEKGKAWNVYSADDQHVELNWFHIWNIGKYIASTDVGKQKR